MEGHEGPCSCFADKDGMFKSPLATIMKKTCSCCGRELPLFSFGPAASSPDGYSPTCDECKHLRLSQNHKGGKPKKELSVLEFSPGVCEDKEFKISFKKMETKVCKRCGREMPLESFPTSNRSKDGHMSVCKECNSKARSEGRWGKKTAHVEEVGLWPPDDAHCPHGPQPGKKAPEPSLEQLSNYPDAMLVAVLRERGWEVTCKRTIVEEL